MATQPVHIDINQEIQDWAKAQYGKEVRSANVSALTKLQTQMNGAVDYVAAKGEEVERAAQDVQEVRLAAQDAVDHANAISGQNKQYVDTAVAEYKEYADTKLSETTAQRELAETAKTGADSAAVLSQSWAVGGTGTRTGEDTENSRYHSLQSKSQADRAKDEADRASQYAQIVAPDFYLDIDSGTLYKKGGTGVDFAVDEDSGALYWKITA